MLASEVINTIKNAAAPYNGFEFTNEAGLVRTGFWDEDSGILVVATRAEYGQTRVLTAYDETEAEVNQLIAAHSP